MKTDVCGREVPDWKGAIVFHSTDKKSADSIMKKGFKCPMIDQGGNYGVAISFTKDKKYSSQFGEYMITVKLSDTIRVLNINDPDDSALLVSLIHGKWIGDWQKIAMKNNIDAVYDPGAGDLFVYNAKAVKVIKVDKINHSLLK